jgi:hypothetical protein
MVGNLDSACRTDSSELDPLIELKRRLRLPAGLTIGAVQRSWISWCKLNKVDEGIRKAGARYLNGQRRVDKAEESLHRFLLEKYEIKLEYDALRPAVAQLEPAIDHIAEFSKVNSGRAFLNSIRGEYALFRPGFTDDDQLVEPKLEGMKPCQLKIFKTARSMYGFRLEAADPKEGRWAGSVVARDKWAYLIGFGAAYDQFLAMALTLESTNRKMLVGTQLIQCRAISSNRMRETCVSRLVACAKKGDDEVADEDKLVAKQWLMDNIRCDQDKSHALTRAFLLSSPATDCLKMEEV